MQNIDTIVSIFESPELIPLSQVLCWLDSTELTVRGAAFAYLEKPNCVARFSPPITQDQFDDRYLNYLKECILEDLTDEWVHSRYEATWALASWFKRAIARDKTHPRLINLRQWLGETYKAMPTLRAALINGFLEHVIEQGSVAAFFSVWEKDWELSTALLQARHWNSGAPPGNFTTNG